MDCRRNASPSELRRSIPRWRHPPTNLPVLRFQNACTHSSGQLVSKSALSKDYRMASSNKAFPGFPVEMVQFFKGLEQNNNREWFQARKSIYEEKVKAPMIDLVTAVNEAMLKFAPDHIVDPAKAIYRIYRDTRFSKDKTPYKTHIAAGFPRRGLAKHGSGGYYFGVSHKGNENAGRVYNANPETPQRVAVKPADGHQR